MGCGWREECGAPENSGSPVRVELKDAEEEALCRVGDRSWFVGEQGVLSSKKRGSHVHNLVVPSEELEWARVRLRPLLDLLGCLNVHPPVSANAVQVPVSLSTQRHPAPSPHGQALPRPPLRHQPERTDRGCAGATAATPGPPGHVPNLTEPLLCVRSTLAHSQPHAGIRPQQHAACGTAWG